MPQIPVGNFYESLRANEFVLVIDQTISPGVSKVTGLSEGDIDIVEQPDGGTGHVYQLAAAKVKFEPLVITRYVDGSPEDRRFRDWFRQTFTLNATVQGGSTVRKNGMVIKRHLGEDVLKFAFYSGWVKSSKFTDLEAGSTNLFTQEITIVHEGLERVE